MAQAPATLTNPTQGLETLPPHPKQKQTPSLGVHLNAWEQPQRWNHKAADPKQNGRECSWVAEVYLHQVSFHLMSFSHEHVCAFVLKLSTATTHTSKHDTIQLGLQSSFLPGAGMREQLLMLVFGVGRTLGKCLGSLSAGGEWRYQTDKLLDHGRPCCLRLDMHW